jgi:CRP-like cAMP-binding protein
VSDHGSMHVVGIENLTRPQAESEKRHSGKSSFHSLSTCYATTIKVRRHRNVYACGDAAQAIYWIQSGYIKQTMNSEHGKECILNIFSEGDFFGESCLVETEHRTDTATAMENTMLPLVELDDDLREATAERPEGRAERGPL